MREGVPADPPGPRPSGGGARAVRPDPHRPREHAALPPEEQAVRDREALLTSAVRTVLGGTDAHGATLHLRSRDRRSLVLCAVAGVPLSVLAPFRRIAAAGPLPVAVGYRTGRTVLLADTEDTMRRFPQLALGLPYDFASAWVPVRAGGETYGVLGVLWPASGDGVPEGARRHLRAVADRLAGGLAGLEEAGHPVEPNGETTVVELTPPSAPTTRVGLFEWDVLAGTVTADDQFCEIFGLAPGDFDGRADTLSARIAPGDLPEFRAAVRVALDGDRVLAARLRVLDRDGHPYPVELWARVPHGRPAQWGRLVGAVLDTRTGTAAAAAVERLRDGVFSLDPDGRITYANHSVELLLQARREDLVGHHPWQVLSWLSDPVYENRYRAALLSQRPTAFLALRPPDNWLAFSLYPDAHGVTGRVVAADPPPDAPAPPAEPAPPGTWTGLGVMYHLLQLASALSEAVTAREVFRAVADEILPALGGQELAIYAVRDKRLHLVSQDGYPDGFLDRFEGIPVGARVPGAETISSAAPIFFESVDELAAAYPELTLDDMGAWAFLPLMASGHSVGSCILGFDRPRVFTVEERGLLTALAGFIAQALERARLYDAEFTLARGLQQALLPHRLPRLEGVRIAARYLPGTRGMEIGGDWYDAIVTGRDLCLVIGDVEGHSVSAAATMGQLRSAVRAFATGGHPPHEVLARTNQLLLDLDPGLLASCCLVRLTPGEGTALVVRAGHVPPVLRRPDGRAEALEVPGGPLLGVDEAAAYPVSPLTLEPGSVLALYTDGLVEDPSAAIDEGVERLCAALAGPDAGWLAAEGPDGLAERVLHELGSTHRVDDIALMLTAYR
ncbi:SpoIIE family protein phosphatase [Kitasatospora sp. NPDC097605]|uniref:SpoIIE family protein phosphatase n=1 Tax=Kitasatospora sp. NPDC097605 TaxID=3157226 RepID=UPI003320F460